MPLLLIFHLLLLRTHWLGYSQTVEPSLAKILFGMIVSSDHHCIDIIVKLVLHFYYPKNKIKNNKKYEKLEF